MTSNAIVVLTGAGISAESGIQTFRGADGLWEGHRVEDVATPEGFAANPELVQRFYNERRKLLLSGEINPNSAHKALARLESEYPGGVLVVTQNIDDLHERAGSRQLIHMHGELLKMFCNVCEQRFDIHDDIIQGEACAACASTGSLRPDVVWFGEMPKQMDEIIAALGQCGLFISIGTSGHVYPAAGFVEIAAQAGSKTVEINLEPTVNGSRFDHHLSGKAGDILPDLVEDLLAAC